MATKKNVKKTKRTLTTKKSPRIGVKVSKKKTAKRAIKTKG